MRKRSNKKLNNSLFNKFNNNIKKINKNIYADMENDINDKSNFTILEVLIIIIISIIFGVVIGYIITYSKYQVGTEAKVNEIITTYNNIIDNYYDKVDKNALADAAVKGMIKSLNDPYSNFIDADNSSSFHDSVDGSFVGIGVTIQFEESLNYNKVLEIMKDSPAEKAGVMVDDIIIAVDGKDVAGLHGDDMSKLIRGEVDTKVVITVKRGEEEKKIAVTRQKVDLISVTSDLLSYEDGNIGYIRIDSFAANTYSQFLKQIKKLEKKEIKSLVIDVRDNPGGHLAQTRKILSLFFNKKVVLYEMETKGKIEKIHSLSNETRDYPVAVLINKGSASASEILASCFKNNYKKAILVGLTTYGKGTVQKTEDLSSGSSIKYTTQKWLTSKGKWVNEKGIKPDFEVNLNDEYFENPNHDTDNQLQEAINKLKESN